MLALPLPLIVALVLTYLVVWAILRGRMHAMLLLFISACAAQGVIAALVHHYGFVSVQLLQPISASCIPALAWLAFVASAQRPLSLRRDVKHAFGPVAAALSVAVLPGLLDVTIPGLFLGYGTALLVTTIRDADGLPGARLESGDVPLRLWQTIGVALIASALSDVVIALSMLGGDVGWLPVVVSVTSSLILLVLGLAGLSRNLDTGAETPVDVAHAEAPTSPYDPAEDAALLARLDHLMKERTPYLDPDLTLAKLARKLKVPAKQLSAAINRNRGENVSRLINRFRIEHACSLLRQGRGVTVAALESGFNTKSNFNREFLRVKQATPSGWLATQVWQAEPD